MAQKCRSTRLYLPRRPNAGASMALTSNQAFITTPGSRWGRCVAWHSPQLTTHTHIQARTNSHTPTRSTDRHAQTHTPQIQMQVHHLCAHRTTTEYTPTHAQIHRPHLCTCMQNIIRSFQSTVWYYPFLCKCTQTVFGHRHTYRHLHILLGSTKMYPLWLNCSPKISVAHTRALTHVSFAITQHLPSDWEKRTDTLCAECVWMHEPSPASLEAANKERWRPPHIPPAGLCPIVFISPSLPRILFFHYFTTVKPPDLVSGAEV